MSDNGINGVDIRGEVLTTEVVWDDTDIVHVVTENLEIQGTPGGPTTPDQDAAWRNWSSPGRGTARD